MICYTSLPCKHRRLQFILRSYLPCLFLSLPVCFLSPSCRCTFLVIHFRPVADLWETQRETPRAHSPSVQPSMTHPTVRDKSSNCNSHCQGNGGTEAAPVCARGAKLATSFSCVALQAREWLRFIVCCQLQKSEEV